MQEEEVEDSEVEEDLEESEVYEQLEYVVVMVE